MRRGGNVDLVLRLREFRKKRGMSQREAAQLSGVGEKSISSFETGQRIDSLKISQLLRLIKVYGVSEEEFFNGHFEEEEVTWEHEDEFLARRRSQIFRRLEHLPESVQSALLNKVHLMIDTADEVQTLTRPRPYAGEHADWQLLTSRN
jgi:transcriptional regulator with XRE-family HTH domain